MASEKNKGNGNLMEQGKNMSSLKSSITTNGTQRMVGLSGEKREAYRSQRKNC